MTEFQDVDLLEEEEGSGEESLAELAFEQIARDISLLSNREVEVEGVDVERTEVRPRAEDEIHLSFKVAFLHEGDVRLGCLFVPLQEAITLACLLLLKPTEEIVKLRDQEDLEQGLKDAMLEIGNMVGGALDNALRWFLPTGYQLRAASCQGVRRTMPPWLDNPEGTTYLVARTRARVDAFDWREWSLVIPDLFELEA